MVYSELKKQVKDRLATQLEFDDSRNLLELGLNSLQVVRLVNQWRKEGIRITFGELMESPTLRDWYELVQKGLRNVRGEKVKKAPQAVIDTPFPLTDVQYAYWIGRQHDQVLGGNGCHAYLEFEGEAVDAEKLKRAWNTVQSHHPMLRARFLSDGRQVIREQPYSTSLPVHDLRNLGNEDLVLAEEGIREKLSGRKLEVEAGQVAGVELTLLPWGRTRVHVDMDLMVADVQSLQILLRDLASAYAGRELPEASGNWSFAAYLEEQAEEEKPEIQRGKKYWEKRIENFPGGPELPLAKRPEEITQARFSRRVMRIGREEWETISKKTAEYGTTPAMLLLTAYALVLERWSTNKHFLINIPLFNRKTEKKGVEEVIADFTTLILLEVDCRSCPTFSQLMVGIQKQFHNDMRYSAYSGIQIQRELSRKRGSHYHAAPVVFACNLGIPLIDEFFREQIGEFTYMISQTPQVWLDYQTYESEEGLMLTWDTVDELFPAGLIDDMFASFGELLAKLGCGDWNQVFDLLPRSRQLFLEKELEIAEPENPRCLHTAFLGQVKKNPAGLAVVDTGKNISLSYGELAELVMPLAAAIVKKGIRGEPVAVTLARGYEQIVALLGILISGNHYVPVSPEQPVARRKLIHEKTGIKYVVTDRKHQQSIEWPGDSGVWVLEEMKQGVPSARYPEVHPDESAYIIMTSGSTGAPKGVEIPHGSAWNTIADINEKYRVCDTDALLGVSSLDFDLSVYDVFGILGTGGRLILIPEEEKKNPDYWLRMINEFGITIWNSVPILLEMLLVVADVYKARSLPLRAVFLSGDWIPMDLPEKLFSLAGECELISMGGATEASIWSNFQRVELPIPENWKSIPYGRPLSGQTYRVVDEAGRDCPFQVAGELLIGGYGVARGYRGDAELTVQKFFEEKGLRWYHTGDMGKIWGDGTIEFLGRKDFQVKVKGHRIELGEIEGAINTLPGIRDCVVCALDNAGNRKKILIAAVVAEQGKYCEAELKTALSEKLPDFMIPARMFFKGDLPVTGNGKRNRKEVLKWIKEQLQENTIASAPASREEFMLLEIWKELFKNGQIGINDNFFELGGDSLSGTRMIAAVKEKAGFGFSLKYVFECNTIKELAGKIKELGGTRSENQARFAIRHREADRYAAFPATEIQYAYWIGRRNIYPLGNVSAYCYYEIECDHTDVKGLRKAWNILVNTHDALRIVFSGDGRTQQVLKQVPEYELKYQDLSGLNEEERSKQILRLREKMAQQILDASRWPLFDIRVCVLGKNRMRLHVGIDTMIMDARSVLFVLKEWTKLYNNKLLTATGKQQLTFRDYVMVLSDIKESVPYSTDRQYWLSRLNSFPVSPGIPLCRTPEEITEQKIRRHETKIDESRWHDIRQRAKSRKLTPSNVLLGVYALALMKYSGNRHFSINVTFDKRMVFDEKLEEVVGDFTSTMLLEVDLRKPEGFASFATRLRDLLTQDLNHCLFTGLDFQRELLKNRGDDFKYGVPVVFTSTLGIKNETRNLFGKVVYNITQTPQVWLDFQIQEFPEGLSFNLDYVEGLVEENLITNILESCHAFLDAFMADSDFMVLKEEDYQEGII